MVYVPTLPDAADFEVVENLISLDIFADFSLEGVTSGSDPTLWDPIRIDEDSSSTEEEEQAEVIDVGSSSEDQGPGVTSGNETPVEREPSVGNVKSSERKYKQR